MNIALRKSSSEKTRSFYNELMSGREKRGFFGKEKRFDPDKINSSPSVHRHFATVVASFLTPSMSCLDLGCGPGGFLIVLAGLCGQVVGVDIVPSFLSEARSAIERHSLTNASTILVDDGPLPFPNAKFDCVVMIDTIHHIENAQASLSEVFRVLKPGGLFLIFEPNKLNPLLALMCVLDPNEHGLLSLGTFSTYWQLLGSRYEILMEVFNGLLIGPSGKLSRAIADFLAHKRVMPLLGWLSPKLFIAARKL